MDCHRRERETLLGVGRKSTIHTERGVTIAAVERIEKVSGKEDRKGE